MKSSFFGWGGSESKCVLRSTPLTGMFFISETPPTCVAISASRGAQNEFVIYTSPSDGCHGAYRNVLALGFYDRQRSPKNDPHQHVGPRLQFVTRYSDRRWSFFVPSPATGKRIPPQQQNTDSYSTHSWPSVYRLGCRSVAAFVLRERAMKRVSSLTL